MVAFALRLLSAPAVADITDSVVTLYVQTASGSGQGTGFVVGQGGRIATAYHVIQGAKSLEIWDSHGRRLQNVSIDGFDAKHDLAVLRSQDAAGLSSFKVSLSTQSFGEIRVVGSPRGLPKQVLFGRLTSTGTIQSTALTSAGGKRVFAEAIDVFPIDVTVYSGLSGAPVVNATGDAIGVFSGSFDEGRGLAWAIPSSYLTQLLDAVPLSKPVADIGTWPDLSLMAPAWVTLKRSYSKPFSSDHLAKLEILEQALRTLQGAWAFSATERSQVSPGCEGAATGAARLEFTTLDAERAVIRGGISLAQSTEALYSRPPDSVLSDDLMIAVCNGNVFLTSNSVRKLNFQAEGSISLAVDDIKEFSADSPQLSSEIDITDCSGNLCTADRYGKKDDGMLEIISDKKLRWGNLILDKQD